MYPRVQCVRYDRAKVECASGRTVLLSLDAFNGLPSNTRIIDLKRRLRCDSCGGKGKVIVSVVWADYAARKARPVYSPAPARPQPLVMAFPIMLPSATRTLSCYAPGTCYYPLTVWPDVRGDMRVLCKSAILGTVCLFAAINANAQYQPYQSLMAPQPPINPPPTARPQYPASWYYDPYTNGSTTCPQGGKTWILSATF